MSDSDQESEESPRPSPPPRTGPGTNPSAIFDQLQQHSSQLAGPQSGSAVQVADQQGQKSKKRNREGESAHGEEEDDADGNQEASKSKKRAKNTNSEEYEENESEEPSKSAKKTTQVSARDFERPSQRFLCLPLTSYRRRNQPSKSPLISLGGYPDGEGKPTSRLRTRTYTTPCRTTPHCIITLCISP